MSVTNLLVARLRDEHAHEAKPRTPTRLEAAEEIERLRTALQGLTDMYARTWDRVDGALVMMPDNINRFEKAHAAARVALGEQTHES